MLTGKRIVVTRYEEEGERFPALLQAKGARVIRIPMIGIAPPEDWGPVDRAINAIEGYDWTIFTSANGVKYFLGRIKELGKEVRSVLANTRIAAVGIKTAKALEGYGIGVDFVPDEFRAEGLIEGFKGMGLSGGRILIPRAEKGREILPEELTRLGFHVDIVVVYRVVRPHVDPRPLKDMLQRGEIDVVTFTSGSCVRNFIETLGKEEYKILLKGVKIACISPVTADVVRSYGLEVHIVPERYTVEDLVEAIEVYYG